MPKVRGISSNAGIHPYLKSDFVWPKIDYSGNGILCDINDLDFTQKRIEEFKQNRIFEFSPYFSRLISLSQSVGERCRVNKNLVYQTGISKWDQDHLKRWKNLKEEEDIILINLGENLWLAETIWIKASF